MKEYTKYNGYRKVGVGTSIHFTILLFIVKMHLHPAYTGYISGTARLRVIHQYLCQCVYLETTSLRGFINEMK